MSVSCIDRNPIPVDSLAACNDCFNTDYCVPVEFGDNTPLEFNVSALNSVNLISDGDFASATGWTIGADWAIAAGVANYTGAIPGTSLSRTTDTVLVEGFYLVKMTLSNVTGSLNFNVTLGGVTVGTVGSGISSGFVNETLYLFKYLTPTDNILSINAANFSFTLDDVEVYRMSEVGFEIKDCDADIVFFSEFDSSSVSYNETGSLSSAQGWTNGSTGTAVLTLDWDAYSLTQGCYCVCIKDAADVTFNYVANGVFDDDDFWTFTNVGASGWSVSSNKLNKAKDATVGTDKAVTTLVTELDILSCYKLTFDTASDNGSEVEVRYTDGTDTDALLATVNVPIGSNSVEIDISGKDISVLSFWAASDDEAFDIDDVVLSKTTDCADCICTTVCVSLTTDHDTTIGRGCNFLLKATNDNNAFGFNFEDVTFEPQVRVFGKLRNLTFETEAEYYTKSTGEKILVYAEVEEKVELQIYEVPEYMHSVINMMMNMDSFMIDGVEYVRVGEYAPNWRKSSAKAPVIVQVAKKTQNRYNTYS